jgi:hypothetical protein
MANGMQIFALLGAQNVILECLVPARTPQTWS